jgi:hypothetical protein
MITQRLAIGLLLVDALGTGCLTSASGRLDPITPHPPAVPPMIEETVGDFRFTLEGGKMVTDNKAGRLLNDEILSRWQREKYITGHRYVPTAQFTGTADYNLTLSGSQYGESSVVLQVLSGLTLLLLPYSVDTRYDVQYTIQNVKTGAEYSAAVEDGYKTWTELLLFVALPFAFRGANETWSNMADHLYEQLRGQGAFGPPSGASP